MSTAGLIKSVWFAVTCFLGGYLFEGVRMGLWALFIWMAFICFLVVRDIYHSYRRGY